MTSRSRRTALADWSPWMRQAREIAAAAPVSGDIPVGALLLDEHARPLASACNQRERDADPCAHAEILALQRAARALGRWRLDGCTLVVTLEPCLMCAGACLASRLARVVYGTPDPAAGAVRSRYATLEDPRLPHRIDVIAGIEADACAAQLRDFFTRLRQTPPDPDPQNTSPPGAAAGSTTPS